MSIEEIFRPDRIYIAIAIIAVVALFFVSVLAGITIRRRQRQVMDHCRYRPRKRLMNNTEKRCFQLLNELFGETFYIIPQVSLSALLNHKVGTQDRHTAYQFIENKVVDFVLCNKRTLRPICAVQIDEEHLKPAKTPIKTPGNNAQDIKRFFQSAHIPFVYLPRAKDINRQDVINEFSRVIYETSILKPGQLPPSSHKIRRKRIK